MGLGAVALAVAILGISGWLAFLITQSRVRHRREAAAQNLSPFLTDDELETTRLNKVLLSALLATAVLAIVMPVYYLNESSRQASAAEHFDEQAIHRGLEWFNEYKCGNCHGANAGGGGARFVEARSGITTTWAAPSLNDVFYRYTTDEVRYWLVYGRPGSPMPAWGAEGGGPLDSQQIDDLLAYLASIQAPQSEVLGGIEAKVTREISRLETADERVTEAIATQQAALDALNAAPAQYAAVEGIPDELESILTGPGMCTDGSAALYGASCSSPGVDTDRDQLTDVAEIELDRLVNAMIENSPPSDSRTALGKVKFDRANAFTTSDGPTPIPDLAEAELVVTEFSTITRDLRITTENNDRLVAAAQQGLDHLLAVQAERPYAIDIPALAEEVFDGDVIKAQRAVALFNAYCARCHTAGYSAGIAFTEWAGSGAFGPSLRDGRSIIQFPDAAAQLAFIIKGSENGKQYGVNGIGRGWMPGFGALLSEEDIMAIIAFERSL